MTVPCFVLGLFDTGLAAVRALAREGLPVTGFDYQPEEYGFRSRFGSPVRCPDTADPFTLTQFLLDRARATGQRPVVYPTSDAFVAFLSEHRAELEPYVRHALPSHGAVAVALDKVAQYRVAAAAGVPVAAPHTPHTRADVVNLADSLPYPAVIKPRIGHEWRRRFRAEKAMRVDNGVQLMAAFEEIFAAGEQALVQPFVPGPNTNHVKVCGYFDAEGRPLALVCMRKIRQYPVDFGVGTLMESVDEPDARELGLRFFEALRWRGPGSIEFKRDERTGRWTLIELNPRLWQQHALAAACGVNFPVLQYRDLTGQPIVVGPYRLGVRWLDEFRDPLSAWGHWRRGALTFAGWLRSLAGVRPLALWAADDPRPFLASLRHHLGRLPRLMWRRRAPAPAATARVST